MGTSGIRKPCGRVGNFVLPILYTLLMLALLRVFVFSLFQDIISGCTPCTMGRTPTRFQQHRVTTTRPMNCYAVSTRLRRSRHRSFFSPIRTWTAVRDQESGLHRNVGASGSTDLMTGKVMFLRSNQGGRFVGNESVADSFRSDLVGFKSWSARILGAFFPLTSARKTSSRETNSLPEVTPILIR
ncbi:hypothetical protein TNCV_2313141 [Trichonephila clavipes]|nr:hypothetical protein TNCV_2313141 [Trichonephila clavipes]